MARNKKGQFAGKTLESDTLGLMTNHGRLHLQGMLTKFAEDIEGLNQVRPLEIVQEFCKAEGIPFTGQNYLESISAQFPQLAHIVALAKVQQDLRQAYRKMMQLQDVLKTLEG